MAKLEYTNEYKVGEVIVPGVTTILKNLGWNKDVLMAWAAKVAKGGGNFKEVSKEASETGTLAHALAEAYLSGDSVPEEVMMAYSDKQRGHARNALGALQDWHHRTSLKIIGTEVTLISEKYMYGGTADVVFENASGNLEIGDIKTSNGTYADYILQLSAYAQAAEEQYRRVVERIHILRFGKGVKGVFHNSSWGVDTMATGMSVFKSLLNIHRLRSELEEQL